jgi:hypothetical protein
MKVAIVGGGVGGLTPELGSPAQDLLLCLH